MPTRFYARALAVAATTSIVVGAATTTAAADHGPGWMGTACGDSQPIPLAVARDLSDTGVVGGHTELVGAATWDRWSGVVQHLGGISEGAPSQITAVSVNGRVAGTASVGTDLFVVAKAVRIEGSLPFAPLDLGTDTSHAVSDINNGNTVVGAASTPGEPARPFRWRAQSEWLAAPGSNYEDLVALGVNEDDWVLGRGERVDADGTTRSGTVLWSPEGSAQELPAVFPRVELEPVHVDEARRVIGGLRVDGNRANGFAEWTGTTYVLVPGPEDNGGIEVLDANDRGDVVGVWTGDDGETVPFLYQAGSGWYRLSAGDPSAPARPTRINNTGDVLVEAAGGPRLWTSCENAPL